MIEGRKDSDEFEKRTWAGLIQTGTPENMSELIVGVMRVFLFEESLLKMKKSYKKKSLHLQGIAQAIEN